MKTCPYCSELNLDDAKLCQSCGRHFDPDVIEGTYSPYTPYQKSGQYIRIIFFTILALLGLSAVLYFWPKSSAITPINNKQGPIIYSTYNGPTAVVTPTITPIVLNQTARRLWNFLNARGLPLSQTVDETGQITIIGKSLDESLVISATFMGEDLIDSRIEIRSSQSSIVNSDNAEIFESYYNLMLPDWEDRERWLNEANKDNNLKLKYGQDPAQFSTVTDRYKVTLIASKINQSVALVIVRE